MENYIINKPIKFEFNEIKNYFFIYYVNINLLQSPYLNISCPKEIFSKYLIKANKFNLDQFIILCNYKINTDNYDIRYIFFNSFQCDYIKYNNFESFKEKISMEELFSVSGEFNYIIMKKNPDMVIKQNYNNNNLNIPLFIMEADITNNKFFVVEKLITDKEQKYLYHINEKDYLKTIFNDSSGNNLWVIVDVALRSFFAPELTIPEIVNKNKLYKIFYNKSEGEILNFGKVLTPGELFYLKNKVDNYGIDTNITINKHLKSVIHCMFKYIISREEYLHLIKHFFNKIGDSIIYDKDFFTEDGNKNLNIVIPKFTAEGIKILPQKVSEKDYSTKIIYFSYLLLEKLKINLPDINIKLILITNNTNLEYYKNLLPFS